MRDPYHKSEEDPYELAEQAREELLARVTRPPRPGVVLGVDVEKASLVHLLVLFPAAVLARIVAWIPLRVRRWMLTIFSVSAMVSPLLIWMAVTKWLLIGLLGNALISIAICCIIVVFSPEDQL